MPIDAPHPQRPERDEDVDHTPGPKSIQRSISGEARIGHTAVENRLDGLLEGIRVLLGHMPRLLSDIVRQSLSDAPDIHVVGDAVDDSRLVQTLDRVDVDVLVVGPQSGGLPRGVVTAMRRHPDLNVLGLSTDGRETVAYELRPYEIGLGPATAESLVQAIRAVARPTE